MTNKERVIASLDHKQPDKVPYHVQFTTGARERMAEYLGDPDFESGLDNAFAVMSIRRKLGYRQVGPNVWQDEFGVRDEMRAVAQVQQIAGTEVSRVRRLRHWSRICWRWTSTSVLRPRRQIR